MAAATVISEGQTVTVTLGGTVAVGDVYEGTDGIGVYMSGGVSGDVVAVLISGEVEIDKETGTAYTLLQHLFFDATSNKLDATNTNIPAGLCTEAAASGATRAKILLNAGGIDT